MKTMQRTACVYVTNVISERYACRYARGKYFPSGNKKSAMMTRLLRGTFDEVRVLSPAFVRGKKLNYIPEYADGDVMYPPSFMGNMVGLIIFTAYLFLVVHRLRKSCMVTICAYNYYIHTHLPARIVSRLLGARLLMEVEDINRLNDAVHPAIRFYAGRNEYRDDRANALVATSSYMKEHLGWSKEPFIFHALYDGITQGSRCLVGGKAMGARKTLAYVGSIDHERNIFEFLGSLQRLDASFLDRHRFIVAGRCRSQVDIQRYDSILRRIEYHGFVDEEQLCSIVSEADVFFNYQRPSEYFFCSFPSKVVEYMRHGAPVLSPYHRDLDKLREWGADIRFYVGPEEFISLVEHLDRGGPKRHGLPTDDEQISMFRAFAATSGLLPGAKLEP